MHGHIDDLPLVFHPCQRGQENQVARAGNGQKFGDALNHGHQKKMKEGHIAPFVIQNAPDINHLKSMRKKYLGPYRM